MKQLTKKELIINFIKIGGEIESFYHDDSFPYTGQEWEKEPLSEKVSKS